MRRLLRSGRRGATRSTGWKAEPDTREGRSIKTYQFNVNSQCIGTSKLNAFVSGSAEIYEAVFSFDASWEGFARTAVFECRGERREQLLVNDRCIIPWEILHAGAFLRVGVYGVDGNKTMPTVYSGQMFIARGAEPSEAAREHSADMFDQIVEIGQQAAEAKEQWESMSAEAETLPAGAEATASYADGVLHLGIPGGTALPERPAFDSRKKYALCLIPNAAGTDWELAWSEFTPQDPAASSIVGTGKVGYMLIA